MIIYMSDIICVTNRKLCQEDFLTRIDRLAKAHPKGIILREKDLTEDAYRKLAEEVLAVCRRYETLCILHTYYHVAAELDHTAIHLPLPVLRSMTSKEKKKFAILGASCHSAENAMEAEQLGCTYITAGHVFDTDCKRGVPGRGLAFLKEVCESVSIPVYAIGGIHNENVHLVREAGAKGVCLMSSAMTGEGILT